MEWTVGNTWTGLPAVSTPPTPPPMTWPSGLQRDTLKPPVRLRGPPLSATKYEPDKHNIWKRPYESWKTEISFSFIKLPNRERKTTKFPNHGKVNAFGNRTKGSHLQLHTYQQWWSFFHMVRPPNVSHQILFFDMITRYSKTIRKDLQQPFSTNAKSCRPFSNNLTLMLDKTKNDSKTQR